MFLFLYLVIETINFIYYFYLYTKYSRPIVKKCTDKTMNDIYDELELISGNELENMYKNSILYNKTNSNIDLEKITYNEMENFIIQTIYSQHEKNDKNKYIIEKTLILFENKLNLKFKNKNENKYIYNKWGKNPILFIPRTFIINILIKIIINWYHYYMIYYKKYNFCKCKHNISFLYQKDDEKENILFIAGLGIGFPPYLKMFNMLKDYNIIILNVPVLHSYYWGEIPDKGLIINEVKEFIKNQNIKKINIISHSFGSYLSYSLQEQEDLKDVINKVMKIDPIIFWINCFQLSNYFVGNYFDYSSLKSYLLDIVVHYLIHYDLHILNICFRKMDAEDFIINLKDFENKKNFYVFSEKDYLISNIFLEKYKNNNNIYIVKNATHGGIFLQKQYENILEKMLLFFKNHETRMVF
jgi:hypothetical protein